MRRRCTIAVVAGLMSLGATASPALADGFTLELAAPTTPVVGKPMVLQATGTIPVQDLWFSYWFSLDAIPTSVTTTCPPDAFEGAQMATGTGGAIIVLTQHENPDSAGNFQVPVGITPTAPGSLLLCGYTDDGAAATLASASLILNIKSAARPRTGTAAIRADALAAIRSCRALLSRSGPCELRAIRRANRRCRRLPSRRSRSTCLRTVRRIGRR